MYCVKMKTEIFTENIEMPTPTNRLNKINKVDDKPRTPFGSLLNRRSKSVENLSQQSFGLKENGRAVGLNDEIAIPKQQKLTPMLKHMNRSSGTRRKIAFLLIEYDGFLISIRGTVFFNKIELYCSLNFGFYKYKSSLIRFLFGNVSFVFLYDFFVV